MKYDSKLKFKCMRLFILFQCTYISEIDNNYWSHCNSSAWVAIPMPMRGKLPTEIPQVFINEFKLNKCDNFRKSWKTSSHCFLSLNNKAVFVVWQLHRGILGVTTTMFIEAYSGHTNREKSNEFPSIADILATLIYWCFSNRPNFQ